MLTYLKRLKEQNDFESLDNRSLNTNTKFYQLLTVKYTIAEPLAKYEKEK